MKRLLLLLILSIFWTLAAAQISLPAASVQPDAAPVAPVGASAADIAATETVIVADPAVDSLSDPAPNAAEPVVRMTLDECMAYAEQLRPMMTDVTAELHELRRADKDIMFEGAQGSLLDIDHGTYPYVTSSNTTVGGALAGAGVGADAIDYVQPGVVYRYSSEGKQLDKFTVGIIPGSFCWR